MSDFKLLKDVLLDIMSNSSELKEVEVILSLRRLWRKIVPEALKSSKPVEIKDRILFVTVEGSTVLQEVKLREAEILEILRAHGFDLEKIYVYIEEG